MTPAAAAASSAAVLLPPSGVADPSPPALLAGGRLVAGSATNRLADVLVPFCRPRPLLRAVRAATPADNNGHDLDRGTVHVH